MSVSADLARRLLQRGEVFSPEDLVLLFAALEPGEVLMIPAAE
jgi:hypothetical protein